jgi:transcriptional regulator with PAS, ATPase and Fis domain
VREAAAAPPRSSPPGPPGLGDRFDDAGLTLKSALEQLECELIRRGLVRTHWNKSQLAKELGISRSSLITKAERYGLDRKPD